MAQGNGIDLDISQWERFIRGLDRESMNEFRKGARKSARELQRSIRADFSGRILRRRTGKSRKSITLRVPTASRILAGKPIESRVASRRFTVRLHEKGYDFRRTRRGRVIKHIPGKNIFEMRTKEHEARHKQIMEETVRGLIQKVKRGNGG